MMKSETYLLNQITDVTSISNRGSEAWQIASALLLTGLIISIVLFVVFGYDAITHLKNSAQVFVSLSSVQAMILLINSISDVIVSVILEFLNTIFTNKV